MAKKKTYELSALIESERDSDNDQSRIENQAYYDAIQDRLYGAISYSEPSLSSLLEEGEGEGEDGLIENGIPGRNGKIKKTRVSQAVMNDLKQRSQKERLVERLKSKGVNLISEEEAKKILMQAKSDINQLEKPDYSTKTDHQLERTERDHLEKNGKNRLKKKRRGRTRKGKHIGFATSKDLRSSSEILLSFSEEEDDYGEDDELLQHCIQKRKQHHNGGPSGKKRRRKRNAELVSCSSNEYSDDESGSQSSDYSDDEESDSCDEDLQDSSYEDNADLSSGKNKKSKKGKKKVKRDKKSKSHGKVAHDGSNPDRKKLANKLPGTSSPGGSRIQHSSEADGQRSSSSKTSSSLRSAKRRRTRGGRKGGDSVIDEINDVLKATGSDELILEISRPNTTVSKPPTSEGRRSKCEREKCTITHNYTQIIVIIITQHYFH